MSITNPSPISWIEIPVSDLDRSAAFYEAVFGWTMERMQMGPNPIACFPYDPAAPAVSGHLYPGTPVVGGPTVHLNLPGTLDDAIAQVRAKGGTVVEMPPIVMPEGRFVYAADPDGTSLGLFEPGQQAA